jgi:hypothetical protein
VNASALPLHTITRSRASALTTANVPFSCKSPSYIPSACLGLIANMMQGS